MGSSAVGGEGREPGLTVSEPGVVFVNNNNVCFAQGGGTPAPKFNVTKLDDREVSGGGPTSSKEEDGG